MKVCVELAVETTLGVVISLPYSESHSSYDSLARCLLLRLPFMPMTSSFFFSFVCSSFYNGQKLFVVEHLIVSDLEGKIPHTV